MRPIRSELARRKALLREPWCVACDEVSSDDPHHVVFKSERGDDVAENLVGICRRCHDLLHDEDIATKRRLGDYILANRWDTLGYIQHKKRETWRAWFLRRFSINVCPSTAGGIVSSNDNLRHPRMADDPRAGAQA